jgi:DGQHR domain-containing protein
MASFTDGLVTGEVAKKINVARAKSVDEKSVTGVKKEALDAKVQGEELDGWSVIKRNKSSVRMSKPKPHDRQLEDDVWSLLYKLGFKELNADRNFTIKLGENAPGRQIDIFAKDDETVFIVECTHAQEQGAKSIKGLIDKINGLRQDVVMAIHAHYGKEPKLKVKWAIATRNVDWRKADKDRAAESKIAIITEQEIAYYTKLTDYIKEAARYQFLARYLKGEGVDGLSIDVPATRGRMGGITFYNFLMSPLDLLKIAYISHKATSTNDLETYQRMVKPSRLKKIAAYIDDGGQFPTNIVINFKTKSPIRFKKSETFENSSFGTITLPGQYGAAWIIDGQHRLYGYAFSERCNAHVIPVLAYENLPADKEMRLFVDINCEQVKVSRSLLHEIYSNLNHGSEDPAKQLEAQYARVALRLDELSFSPIRDRVLTVSKDKDNHRCLTLTSLADGIKENRFLGTVTQQSPNMPMIHPGPLTDLSGDWDVTTEKAADVLAGYFSFFAKGVPGNWETGDAKGGFLCTNNGLRALLRLLKELVGFIEAQDELKAFTLDAEDLIDRLAPLVAPLVEFFQNADQSEIQNFRSRQALDGVKKNCLGMMGIIAEAKPEFTSKELEEYLNSRDKEGTKVAREMIDKVNLLLFHDVLQQLKEHYGEVKDAWWWKGIPQATREKCDAQVNRDNGVKDRWQYLSLADYQTIIPNNWELFDKRYDFGDKGKKADKVSWIGRLNRIRQTTHHPEKGLISKDDVDYVKTIYAHVMEKIQNIPQSRAA